MNSFLSDWGTKKVFECSILCLNYQIDFDKIKTKTNCEFLEIFLIRFNYGRIRYNSENYKKKKKLFPDPKNIIGTILIVKHT